MKKKIFVKWLRILSSALILASLVSLGVGQTVVSANNECEEPGAGCENSDKSLVVDQVCINDTSGQSGHCSECPADYRWNASAEERQKIISNCECGDWSDWSVCVNGMQSRSRDCVCEDGEKICACVTGQGRLCEDDVNCEGYWGPCIGECGITGTQTFYITQPKVGNGASCEYEDGDTQDCQTEACPVNLCGNGKLDPGESCDDGNRINGDGCNASCASEITVPGIPVTGGAGGPDEALLIPVTGVDLTTCALQSKYLSLSKVYMLIGMGCLGISLVMDGFPKKKKG